MFCEKLSQFFKLLKENDVLKVLFTIFNLTSALGNVIQKPIPFLDLQYLLVLKGEKCYKKVGNVK